MRTRSRQTRRVTSCARPTTSCATNSWRSSRRSRKSFARNVTPLLLRAPCLRLSRREAPRPTEVLPRADNRPTEALPRVDNPEKRKLSSANHARRRSPSIGHQSRALPSRPSREGRPRSGRHRQQQRRQRQRRRQRRQLWRSTWVLSCHTAPTIITSTTSLITAKVLPFELRPTLEEHSRLLACMMARILPRAMSQRRWRQLVKQQ